MFPFRLYIPSSSLTPLLVLSQLQKMVTYIVTLKTCSKEGAWSWFPRKVSLSPSISTNMMILYENNLTSFSTVQGLGSESGDAAVLWKGSSH